MRNSLVKYYTQAKIARQNFNNQLFGDKNFKKFVIISDSRTGSTLLMQMLNSHPNIIAEGEIFKNLNGKSCKSIWDKVFSKRSKKAKYVGFKLFYFHPWGNQDKQVWEFIDQDNSVTIIHLTRKDILRSFVSKKIGLKTKKWTENINRSHNLSLEDRKVVLGPKDCKANFEEVFQHREKTNERFKNHKIISVVYEDLDRNKQKVMNSVFSQLGLPEFKMETYMKKQNPENLKDLIINYDELADVFKNTKWKYLFPNAPVNQT